MAGLAAVAHEVQVKLVVQLRRDRVGENFLGPLGARALRDPAQAPAHPVDVRVYREGGHVALKKQHDRSDGTGGWRPRPVMAGAFPRQSAPVAKACRRRMANPLLIAGQPDTASPGECRHDA
jgi:hypothetical protein